MESELQLCSQCGMLILVGETRYSTGPDTTPAHVHCFVRLLQAQAAEWQQRYEAERARAERLEAEVARLTTVAEAAKDFVSYGPPMVKEAYTDGERWTLVCCDQRQDRGHAADCLYVALKAAGQPGSAAMRTTSDGILQDRVAAI